MSEQFDWIPLWLFTVSTRLPKGDFIVITNTEGKD